MNLTQRTNRDGLAIITLARPEKLNALNSALLDGLDAELNKAEEDDCQGIILIGSTRAFSVGADLGETGVEIGPRIRRMHELVQRLRDFPKISVAAIGGYALGGGLELALACTFRVGAANASLGLPEVGLGALPVYGGTQTLPRLIGAGRALEFMLSGDPVDAETAYGWGLLNRIAAPDEDLLDVACHFMASFTRHDLRAQRVIRRAVSEGMHGSLSEGLAVEAALGHTLAADPAAQSQFAQRFANRSGLEL